MEKGIKKSPEILKKEQFDSGALAMERERIFDVIRELEKKDKHVDTYNLVARIFEHSVDDGLKAFEKMQDFGPHDLLLILGRKQFLIKHPDFISKLNEEVLNKSHILLSSKINALQDETAIKISGFNNKLDKLVKEIEEMRKYNPMPWEEMFGEEKKYLESTEAKKVFDEIDKHYAKYLKARDIKLEEEEIEGVPNSVVDKANKQLKKIEASMEGRYLSGEFEKIIFERIKEKDPEWLKKEFKNIWNKNEALQEIYPDLEKYVEKKLKEKEMTSEKREAIFHYMSGFVPEQTIKEFRYGDPLIHPELADKVLAGVGTFDEEVEKKFREKFEKKLKEAQYKPLDIVYQREKKSNEDNLIKNLNNLLESNGKNSEVVLNKEKDEFEIKDKLPASSEAVGGIKKAEKIDLSDTNRYIKEGGEKFGDFDFYKVKDLKTDKYLFVRDDGLVATKDFIHISFWKMLPDQKIQIIGSRENEGWVTEVLSYDPENETIKTEEFTKKEGSNEKKFSEIGNYVGNVSDYALTGGIDIKDHRIWKGKKDNKFFIIAAAPSSDPNKVNKDIRIIGGPYTWIKNYGEIKDGKLSISALKEGGEIEEWVIEIVSFEEEKKNKEKMENVRFLPPKDVTTDYMKKRMESFRNTPMDQEKIIGGKYYFRLTKENGKRIILNEDGKIIGENYEDVGEIYDLGGELAFDFQDEDGSWGTALESNILSYDDTGIIMKGGLMVSKSKFQNKEFIKKAGGSISGNYELVGNPRFIGERAVFKAKKGDKWIIATEDGKEFGEKYDGIVNIFDVNGKIFYEAYKDLESSDNTLIVSEDGVEYGRNYDSAEKPFYWNGKIAYVAMVYGKKGGQNEFIAIEDELHDIHEIKEKDIRWIRSPIVIGERCVFVAKIGNTEKVVTDQGEILSSQFDDLEAVSRENNQIIIVGKYNGKYKKEIIEFEGEEKDIETNEEEKKLLSLLNMVHKPELEKIHGYFTELEKGESPKNIQQKLVEAMESSYKFAKYTLPKLIKKAPEIFLKTMSAKRDLATEHLARKVLFKIMPELYERETTSHWGGLSLWGERGGRPRPRPENYLENTSSDPFGGGDPLERQRGEQKEILKLRENIREIISTGIYGKYEATPPGGGASWNKVNFTLSTIITDPSKEITITIPNVENVQNINLPKTLNSKIIKERVKGIKKNGEEIPLEVEINSLGEGVILDKKDAKQVVYSLEQNLVPEKMRDISQSDYDNYKKKFERDYVQRMSSDIINAKQRQEFEKEHIHDLSEEITPLPEELDMFLVLIKNNSPKQKIMAIEKFVRDISFYDMDNAEVAPTKRGKTIEEKMMIMEERLEELKTRMPEYAEQLGRKKYAGVCADFAMLTSTLLRRAGVLSGMVSGFQPLGKSVTTAEAHGVSFVLLPDEMGRNKIFTIDGTPHGITEEQEARLAEMGVLAPSREEIENTADKEISEIQKEADREMEKILDVIRGQNEDEIKKLTNGQLEKALNNILKYSVKISHLEAVRGVMEGYWYTPVAGLDLSEPQNRVEAGKFFESQLKDMRRQFEKSPEEIEKPAGTYLFDTVREFAERFIKQKKAGSLEESYAILESLVDIAWKELNDIERKAMAAIITYLRAKKIRFGE